MKKAIDWPTRLAEFLLEKRHEPFKWGVNDCCLFAADAIMAMGGDDVAHDVRGRYKSAIGARRIMKGLGAQDLIELLTQRLGEADGWLTRGAIVVIKYHEQLVTGVYYQKPWALTENGLIGMPLGSVERVWSLR